MYKFGFRVKLNAIEFDLFLKIITNNFEQFSMQQVLWQVIYIHM